MAHFLSPTLSRDSLKNILKDLDSIPDEHRLKLWIGLVLNLPNNKSQYLNLRKLGKNIPCTKIYDKEEIKNKIICRVVQSLLAHCPTLKNFRNFNLAGFVEPFSVLLISHEFVYFEVMLTILGENNNSKVLKNIITILIYCSELVPTLVWSHSIAPLHSLINDGYNIFEIWSWTIQAPCK